MTIPDLSSMLMSPWCGVEKKQINGERVHMGSWRVSSISKGILTTLRLRWRDKMLARPYKRRYSWTKKERKKRKRGEKRHIKHDFEAISQTCQTKWANRHPRRYLLFLIRFLVIICWFVIFLEPEFTALEISPNRSKTFVPFSAELYYLL